MKSLMVQQSAPQRLDKYLQQQFPSVGFGRWSRAVKENKVKVNGKKQPLSYRVAQGDEIRIYLSDDILQLAPQDGPLFLSARKELSVVYEDENLLICNKPSGLAVYGEQADTLLHRAQRYLYEKGEYLPESQMPPCLCHRLDTGTSGLVMVAKNPQTEQFISDLMAAHQLKKEYLCVTFGRPSPANAVLRDYLYKDAAKGIVYVEKQKRAGCKPIETHYETICVSGRLALLKVRLITGRTHQIRAHMASIGCPILGDSKYGNQAANRELKLKYQALCSWKLTFPTISDKRYAALSGLEVCAPYPWYYSQMLEHQLDGADKK